MGLVNEVIAPEELQLRARKLAEELLENSPASLRATKALLRDYLRAGIERDLRSGMEANAGMRQTADFEEGVRSFLERRKPRWSE
jgi:methylglutaconyl-CoA hydratase